MPVRVIETHDSRSVSGNVIMFRFAAIGSIDLETVADAVILSGLCPPAYGYYRRRLLEKTMTADGPDFMRVEVPYALPDNQYLVPSGTSGGPPPSPGQPGSYTLPGEEEPLGPEWSLDFSETTRKLTKSFKHFGGVDWNGLAFPGPPGVIGSDIDAGTDPFDPDAGIENPKGAAIGFDPKTGETNGIDVPDGTTRIQISVKLPVFTFRYVRDKIRRLRGRVNSAPFMHHEVGEVRFAGGQFGFRYADGISALYTFDIKPNLTDIKVTDQITIPFLRGWDYLEIFYDYKVLPDTEEGTTPFLKVAKWATVHQVLPYADLNEILS